MKTLRIRNRDLVVGPAGYDLVSGSDKLRQDLTMATIEPIGADRFHPGWGSRLWEMIGISIDDEQRMQLWSEIIRVVKNYAAVQADEARNDSLNSRRSRYRTSEVLAALTSIDVIPNADTLSVTINIQTMSGESISLDVQPLGA